MYKFLKSRCEYRSPSPLHRGLFRMAHIRIRVGRAASTLQRPNSTQLSRRPSILLLLLLRLPTTQTTPLHAAASPRRTHPLQHHERSHAQTHIRAEGTAVFNPPNATHAAPPVPNAPETNARARFRSQQTCRTERERSNLSTN